MWLAADYWLVRGWRWGKVRGGGGGGGGVGKWLGGDV